MDHIEISKELSAFIEESPSMFHTVEAVRKRLDAAGFRYLPETEQWDIEEGDRCYTVRNGSSIIAFQSRQISFRRKLQFPHMRFSQRFAVLQGESSAGA